MLSFEKRPSWQRLIFGLRGCALVRIRYRLIAVFCVSVALTVLTETGGLKASQTVGILVAPALPW